MGTPPNMLVSPETLCEYVNAALAEAPRFEERALKASTQPDGRIILEDVIGPFASLIFDSGTVIVAPPESPSKTLVPHLRKEALEMVADYLEASGMTIFYVNWD